MTHNDLASQLGPRCQVPLGVEETVDFCQTNLKSNGQMSNTCQTHDKPWQWTSLDFRPDNWHQLATKQWQNTNNWQTKNQFWVQPLHLLGFILSQRSILKKLKIPIEYGLLHDLKAQVRLEVQDMGCPEHSQAPVHAKIHWPRFHRHINVYYSNPCKPGTFMRFCRFLKWLITTQLDPNCVFDTWLLGNLRWYLSCVYLILAPRQKMKEGCLQFRMSNIAVSDLHKNGSRWSVQWFPLNSWKGSSSRCFNTVLDQWSLLQPFNYMSTIYFSC